MIKIEIQNLSLYALNDPVCRLVDEWNTLVAENLTWSDAIKIRDLWNASEAVKTPVPSSPETEETIERRIEQSVAQWSLEAGLYWDFALARLYPDYAVSKRLLTIKGIVLEFAQPPKLYVERRTGIVRRWNLISDRRKKS